MLRSPAPPLVALVALACGCTPRATPTRTPTPTASLGFFVTSRGVDGSADLGGLAGADAHCQRLAASIGAGARRWRAYLSASGSGDDGPVHARDRIGTGPWFNAAGALVARDLDELHGERHHLDARTALDERGRAIADDSHDMLTGSDAEGRLALVDGRPATCGDWTAHGDGVAAIGHSDRMDPASFSNPRFARFDGSWNAAHLSIGCDAARLRETGGAGQFYCFAADPGRPAPPAAIDRHRYAFRRGVNVNHWLGDILAADGDPLRGYGAPWFDDEDLAWIAAQGFDHVRVWVNGARWLDRDGRLDLAAVAPFDRLLADAQRRGLGVILAMHGVRGFRSEIRGAPAAADAASPFADPATRGDAAYLWWAVAHHFQDAGAGLRFDVLVDAPADGVDELRVFQAEALEAIRRIDRDRVVYLAPRRGSLEHVDDVLFGDPNTALAVRFDEPAVVKFQFDGSGGIALPFPVEIPDLHARASELLDPGWVRYSNTRWTEQSVAELLTRQLEAASRHARRHEVYVSVLGAMQGLDDASARRYLGTIRDVLARQGVGWAVYDYHTGGAVRADEGTGGPTRVVEALGLGRPHPRG